MGAVRQHMLRQSGQGIGHDAGFLGLLAHIDLAQHGLDHVQRGGALFQRIGQLDGIQGVHQGKGPGHLRGLAALHMADHVPADVTALGLVHQLLPFLQGFLHIVLAKIHLSGGSHTGHVSGRMQLGNSDQAYLFRRAAGTGDGLAQPLQHGTVAFTQGGIIHHHAFLYRDSAPMPSSRRKAVSSVQFSRTLTHSSRCTLPPMSSRMS